MSFDGLVTDELKAIQTHLETQYPTYGVYIGEKTDDEEIYPAITIIPVPSGPMLIDGIWQIPYMVSVFTDITSKDPIDSLDICEPVIETVRDYYTANNTEPLTAAGKWGKVTGGYFQEYYSREDYFNVYQFVVIVYRLLSTTGGLGTIRLEYSTYDITLSLITSVNWDISKPQLVIEPTSDELPSGIDRRSYSSVFRINAILIGSAARTDGKAIQDMLKCQFGDLSANNITMTFTGALETLHGSSFNVAPVMGSIANITSRDGEQFIVRVNGLSLQEVKV